jgi:tRNA pseudouridine55 synthase
LKRPASAVWLMSKPVGVTSASVVDDFRRVHSGNYALKVSHGGVLDPFAEGLLIILVGAANRLFEALHEVPKRYVATVAWGLETSTGDAGGAPMRRGDAEVLREAMLDEALAGFTGWTEQVPPATSNKRVGGERAYVRAHRGEVVSLPAQRVYLSQAKWVTHALPHHSVLELSVRGGFYVRSLAVDLGRRLGVGAHLQSLRRTQIGPWAVPERPLMLTGRAVLPWLPSLELSDAAWGELRSQGTAPLVPVSPAEWPLPTGFPPAKAGVRAFHQGKLVALVGGPTVTLLPGGI